MKPTSIALYIVSALLFAVGIFAGRTYVQNQALVEQNQALETELTQQPTIENIPSPEATSEGVVKGVASPIGNISGTLTLQSPEAQQNAQTLIVCAQNMKTNQEYCSDDLAIQSGNTLSYTLELPPAIYTVFAMAPPAEQKIMYSDGSQSNPRAIQLMESQEERDIDITL